MYNIYLYKLLLVSLIFVYFKFDSNIIQKFLFHTYKINVVLEEEGVNESKCNQAESEGVQSNVAISVLYHSSKRTC